MRDSLGARDETSMISLPPIGVWIRNAAIGAGLVAINALRELLAAPANHEAQSIALVLAGAGAAAGLGFTALTPVRKASRAGHYITWVVAVLVALVGTLLPFWLAGDESALNILRMPIGWLFLLGSATATGVFCARVADRWSRGDYR